ncbi:MAG: ABC transporter permease subunit [Rectinemataceae bacterium]
MVQSRSRRRLYFLAFVLPAFALYALFFIYPFARGLAISFTNWDGLTPKSPISMPAEEFEARILDKVTSRSDRAFLFHVYSIDPGDGAYHRLALRGLARYRVERILASVGYEPEGFRSVGLSNYRDIFAGKVDARFYPRIYTKTNYNENADLPKEIDKGQFEGVILPRLGASARSEAFVYYKLAGTSYKLVPAYDEVPLEDDIWSLPEINQRNSVPPTAVDSLITDIKNAGLADDRAAAESALANFLGRARFSAESQRMAKASVEEIFALGPFRHELAAAWVQRKVDLGVVGFTIFFTVFSVLFANLFAFFIALALDTRMRSKNVLRTVFFLPNVLSMIVVALIWSIIFAQLLPRLTGVELWLGDPDKAPWLVVLVAVWQMAGYYMVIYLAGLQNIPTDVLEAATIDGATGRQRLAKVVLPLLAPAITVCLFLSTANALKCFDLTYALTGPSGYALGTVPFVMDIFFDAFAKKMAGLATAKATLLFLVILAVTGVQLLAMKRREVRE